MTINEENIYGFRPMKWIDKKNTVMIMNIEHELNSLFGNSIHAITAVCGEFRFI